MDAFDSCIRNKRLLPFAATEELIAKEINAARQELERAQLCFHQSRMEDSVVQSYFAMYKSARSLILSAGYKETNLYSLVAAATRLYVEPGAIDPELIHILKIAKDQKDLVQEGARCGPRDTRVILSAAEKFVQRAQELLGFAAEGHPPPQQD